MKKLSALLLVLLNLSISSCQAMQCVKDCFVACFNNCIYDCRPERPSAYDRGMVPSRVRRSDLNSNASTPLLRDVVSDPCDLVQCGKCKLGKTVCWMTCGCCLIGYCGLICIDNCRRQKIVEESPDLWVHKVDPVLGWEPIHVASWSGDEGLLQELLEANANPNDLTAVPGASFNLGRNGQSWCTHKMITDLGLSEFEAEQLTAIEFQPAPLHLAIYKYKTNPEQFDQIIIQLIEYGADPDLHASKKYNQKLKDFIENHRGVEFETLNLGAKRTPRALARELDIPEYSSLFERGKQKAEQRFKGIMAQLAEVLLNNMPNVNLHNIILQYIQVFPHQWGKSLSMDYIEEDDEKDLKEGKAGDAEKGDAKENVAAIEIDLTNSLALV